MNKKGFTLVELLAIIAVLTIIVLVSAPPLIATLKKDTNLTYESNIQDILLAASSFNSIHEGKMEQVSVADLKKEGYITSNIINPKDNTEMNGCVYFEDGNYTYYEKTCTTIINK